MFLTSSALCRTLWFGLLLGCTSQKAVTVDTGQVVTAASDSDGDGYQIGEDCNDADSAVNPGALEICDGIDNDCDDVIDEESGDIYYADVDADGFGDGAVTTESCSIPDGYSATAGDCDDADEAIHPGAPELCDDSDNDCDGEIDEDGTESWYADADADGWGDGADVITGCDAADGYTAAAGDCDDSDDAIHPDAEELCNEADDDCDGDIDEDVQETFYLDLDADGWGRSDSALTGCVAPSGYAALDGDCDDGDDAVHPGADESDCTDPTDYNCDGSVGYTDADTDGWAACEDCDDTTSDVHPSASEICNEVDDDCDGDTDDADSSLDVSTAQTWFSDDDGDGFGDASAALLACEQPAGAVTDATDCDDQNNTVNPDASEICDPSGPALDNDCDGAIDDADGSLDTSTADTWYGDADGDGFGSADDPVLACQQPSGAVSSDDDCDDADEAIHPDAEEVCDETDNDCDGDIDEDASTHTGADEWVIDYDGDPYGTDAYTTESCEQPSGYVAGDAADCDDTDPEISPDAEDTCDGLDNDCDGITDPDGLDSDGDGTADCVDPSVYSYDFDDSAWTNWSTLDLGGGNAPSWSMSDGVLTESSDAALSFATGPDLGELEEFTIAVDVLSAGSANNAAGIGFAVDGASDYWLASWLDPNDYYGTYSSGGRVELTQCVAGTCTTLGADDGTWDLSRASDEWASLAVSVNAGVIAVSLDGLELVSYSSGTSPLGPGTIGLYTYDNDGEITYDDLTVTNP